MADSVRVQSTGTFVVDLSLFVFGKTCYDRRAGHGRYAQFHRWEDRLAAGRHIG